jgi:hypothetical protein
MTDLLRIVILAPVAIVLVYALLGLCASRMR